MRDDKTIDRIIVTINDRMNFCCGRKMIEISNQDWRNFVCDEAFDYKLFCEIIRRYGEGGGATELDKAVPRIKAAYFRALSEERRPAAKQSALPCGGCDGARLVWIATEMETRRIVDFRHEPWNWDICIGTAPCPLCQGMKYSEAVRRKVTNAYMPLQVPPNSSWYPKEAGDVEISGEIAIKYPPPRQNQSK